MRSKRNHSMTHPSDIDWRLYGILDPQQTLHPWEKALEDAILGGLRLVQWRDKREGPSSRERFNLASRCVGMVRQVGGVCIVNDRVDLALAAGAHGVHLGPHDLPVGALRSWAPRGFLIGASAGTALMAAELQTQGADYLGIGALYDARQSKPDASAPRGLAVVREVREAVGQAYPFVGIGGVDATRLKEVIEAGANGGAMIRGVFAQPDVMQATRDILASLG